jgi:hypothetical protein
LSKRYRYAQLRLYITRGEMDRVWCGVARWPLDDVSMREVSAGAVESLTCKDMDMKTERFSRFSRCYETDDTAPRAIQGRCAFVWAGERSAAAGRWRGQRRTEHAARLLGQLTG